MSLEIILLSLYFFWFLILTFLFVKFYLYYQKITHSSKKQNLSEILDEIFSKDRTVQKEIEQLEKQYATLEKESKGHIQKIGFVRFNPFKDTGGDQSFILAILDGKDSGVVISSLHSRTGTRWYAKKVAQGKGLEYTLSSDEEKAIHQAREVS